MKKLISLATIILLFIGCSDDNYEPTSTQYIFETTGPSMFIQYTDENNKLVDVTNNGSYYEYNFDNSLDGKYCKLQSLSTNIETVTITLIRNDRIRYKEDKKGLYVELEIEYHKEEDED